MRRPNSQILSVGRYLVVRHCLEHWPSLDKVLLGVSRLLTARAGPEPVQVDQGDLYASQHLSVHLRYATHSLGSLASCHSGIVLPFTQEDFFSTAN